MGLQSRAKYILFTWHFSANLEYLQKWSFYSLSGQPVSGHSESEIFLLFRENLWKEVDAPFLETFKHPVLQFAPFAPSAVSLRGCNSLHWAKKKKTHLSFCFRLKQKTVAQGNSWKYIFAHFWEKPMWVQQSMLKHAQPCQPLVAAVWHWACLTLQRCEILPSSTQNTFFSQN